MALRTISAPAVQRISRSTVKTPEEVIAAAQVRVQHLEAALAACGGFQNAESATLETLLQRARPQAKVPVPEDQVNRCEEFVARAGRRVQQAEEQVSKALERKPQMELELELSEGQERLARLQEELRMSVNQVPAPGQTSNGK